MVHEVGNKVMVDGEECEVLVVYGGGSGYMVETPDGTAKKVVAEQVSEVEDKEPEPEPEPEPAPEPEPVPEPEPEPEPKPEGEGEGDGGGGSEEE